VIDFGVARWADASAAEGDLTTTGQFLGTLRYTSPEQLPSSRGPVDARSDVYSLGVILYELLSGSRPDDVAREAMPPQRTIASRFPGRLRRLNPAVSPAVERIVVRCLAGNPADRFPDAAALATALQDSLAPPPLPLLSRRFAVAGLVGGAIAVPLALVAARRRAGGPTEHAFRFDLREPPGAEVVRADRAAINAEPFSDVVYWAPQAPGTWAEIVYRLQAPFPIRTATFSAIDIYAANIHNEVTFDEFAEARIDVSGDGERWTPLAASTPTAPRLRDDEGAAAALAGSETVFVRARLYESRSFNRNRVHYAQFLRSEPALGRIPTLTVFRTMPATRLEPPAWDGRQSGG